MPQGEIKRIVSDRGFGFIAAKPQDVFFHHTSVAEGTFDDLREGQTVEYEVEQGGGGGKGPRAVNVRPA